jgi:DNA invertase Pin-like site-specific DNA recombinase
MTLTPIAPPKCALYARVSTEDQRCDLQLNELRAYVERRGWTLYGEYVDTGWSGAKKSRPQLDKLMAAARLHKFDVILCWKLDRFGRSVANFVEHLEQLQAAGGMTRI